MKPFIPRFALAEATNPASATANDMMSPFKQLAYQPDFGRAVPPRHYHGPEQDYSAFARRFPGFAVTLGSVDARYFPTGIRAGDEPLETMFGGEILRFWNRRIAPALGVAAIN